MPMRKPIVLGLAIAVLGLLFAGWLRMDSAPARTANDDDATAAADGARDNRRGLPPPDESVALGNSAGGLPLPPPDAPLAGIYPELKRRADAGDAHAACRVAFELIRCGTLRRERTVIDGWLKREETFNDTPAFREAANLFAHDQLTVAQHARDCDAVPVADLEAGGEYLHRAAAAGVLDAQVHYIEGHMFGLVADRFTRAPGHAYLHHPEFERWRREAPVMAQALVDARRSVGLFLLADAYLHDERPFEALYADDPALAFAYVEMSRALTGRPPRPDAQFSPAERARIAALRLRYPAAQFDADDGSRGAIVSPALQLDETRTRCD
jgi:hypothetical protein